MNSSPQRGTFHIEAQLKNLEEGNTTAEKAEEMIEFYKSWTERTKELEQTDEWRQNNMEYDLRSTEWICDKAKKNKAYAQNLYAAICNNDFTKNDVWPILTDQRWSASWRSAGGIIANMREEGDYIDWYCSGIRNDTGHDPSVSRYYPNGYVPESTVTDEIRDDLLKLGWIVVVDSKD